MLAIGDIDTKNPYIRRGKIMAGSVGQASNITCISFIKIGK